jgi:hypothetical protein
MSRGLVKRYVMRRDTDRHPVYLFLASGIAARMDGRCESTNKVSRRFLHSPRVYEGENGERAWTAHTDDASRRTSIIGVCSRYKSF